MPITQFRRTIQDLNFSFIQDKGTSGVLLTQDYENLPEAISAPDILFALETAKNKFGADAVYFRYFQDGKVSVPQLYIFDFTHKLISIKEKNHIHRNMWNGYEVPAYVIIEQSLVSFFDAREKPEYDRDNYAKEIIIKTGEAIKGFNAKSFDDGLFWEEQERKSHFKFEQSATKDLIRGLKEVYASFQEKSNLDKHVALKLLVQCLLVKYLEERDEDSQTGYFAKTYFKKHFQCSNFCEVIRQGRLLDLLDKLASDFNGKIFEWDKKSELIERTSIQKSEIKDLADYLDANIEDNQYVLWRLYSFSHLPVEVISSVYEELLTDSKDIVYTPEMIVSTLVNECMPLKSPQKDFKLIDVSCGSGIFLVKAYKRIVQWWRYEQWQKTGQLEKPPLSVLNELLLKSIYGVDIEQDAIRLSIFSLALAILDEVNLDPPTWGKLRFPNLNSNIIVKNFFEYITESQSSNFSLVIGNPPFNLPEVDGVEPGRKKYFEELGKRIGYSSDINIPDENPALHFLVQSMKLLKTDGMLSMIQPSGPLLYHKNIRFKNDVFSKYNLVQVIDLTKLADKLWGRKNVSTVAVFLQKNNPDNKQILHLIANRTFSNVNRLFLEFDYYDFHFIDQSEAIDNPNIWKANLLGGGRIVQFINKLSKLPTLRTFLNSKKKEEQWVFGDGFIKGKSDSELKPSDFLKKKGRYNEFAYLYGSKCIETISFNESDKIKTYVLYGRFYQWGRTEELFQPPLLLIKKVIGQEEIPTKLFDTPISYRAQIVGIHAPEQYKNDLLDLSGYFKREKDLIRFFILTTSAQLLVSRATAIFSEDIFSIPYDKVLINNLVSDAERILINDSLKYHISLFNSEIFQYASEPEIFNYSNIFCKTLNSVYKTREKLFQLCKIIDAKNYYALHFEYTVDTINSTSVQVADINKYIEYILPQKDSKNESIHIQKIMKVYGTDSIILIKPKQLRYWFPSIALRDADEVFSDYIKSRY